MPTWEEFARARIFKPLGMNSTIYSIQETVKRHQTFSMSQRNSCFNVEDPVGKKPNSTTVDEYIRSFPRDVQKKLTQLRNLVKEAAPDAEERLSYQMPAFFLNGVLVWFAAHSKHIGFYPKASGIARFKGDLEGYTFAKGSLQFPLDKPLPSQLVTKMVKFRVEENLEKRKTKAR